MTARAGAWTATLAVLAFYGAVAAVWTWPAVRFDPDLLPTRHFDLLPMIWLLERAPGTFPGMLHRASAWPLGESLARVDSYVLLAVAWLNGGRIPAWILARLLLWLGPAVSALAAERCAARGLGVPRPWSLLAGLVYGFSGIAASAALEGHAFHLLAPWLPLLCLALLEGTARIGNDGAPRSTRHALAWGLAAAVAWSLGLFTTAYLGIAGAVLAAALLVRAPLARTADGRRGGGRSLLPLATFLPGVLAAGAYYTWLFARGGRWADGEVNPTLFLRMGSTTLGGLAAASEAVDLGWHSIAAPVGFVGFWLLLLAPVVLVRRPGWRTLTLVGLGALLFTLGRSIRADVDARAWISPVALLADLPGLQYFRFPIRLAWLYALCAGLVGSAVLARLADLARALPRPPHPAWLRAVLVLAVLDVFVGTGLPGRLRRQVAATPSAYGAAPEDRAVLDLYGEAFDRSSGELEMWARNLACYHQAWHGRPIFEVCIGTSVESPRELAGRWVGMALLAAETAGDPDLALDRVRSRLQDLGVGAVALHPDFFRPSDARALARSLEALLGAPLAESRDGGEHLLVYGVAAPSAPVDPAGAWARLVGELR